MAPRRFEDLLDDAVALDDPIARYKALDDLVEPVAELPTRLRLERGRAVRELRARDPRPTWAELGELLGVSGERLRQLADEQKETNPQ